ncbi:MAG: hypothetical protein E7588_06960 [Ruminococcaceae bacterium]|nr:hypothetical protein [Oscillospiraceae bacterium]
MKTLNKTLPLIFVIAAVILLSLCFYRNQLGVSGQDWFMTYQDDSDLHIRGRITRTIETGNPFSDHALIGQYAVIDSQEKYDPYFRQIGIQGLYASFVQKLTGANLEDTVRYTRMLNSFLCALVCALFSFWLWKEFNKTTAVISVFLFAFSPWLTVSARNLYWATWLMLLPAVLMLMLLHRDAVRRKYSNVLAFLLCFVSLFLKCGAGYEFVSCVLVCMELPFIYYAVKNNWSIKKFFGRAIVSGLGGIAGFAAAIGINLFQCRLLVGDFSTAVQLMMENISKRTGAFGIEQTNELIIASLNVSPITVINTYLFSGEPVLFSFTMAEIIAFFLVMLCVHIVTGKGSNAAYSASVVSLIGPVSWMVLAKGHSYIHCHINYILWSIPTVYVMTLSGLGTLYRLVRDSYLNAKSLTRKITVVAVPVILALYIIACFYMRNNVRGW